MSFVFTLGCDPEVFVKKNGKAISAHGLVEGSKASPQKTQFGAVQVDGMALELNTNPTSQHDFEGFNLNIVETLKDLKKLSGVKTLVIDPVMEFDPEYLATLPEEALELGCDPDYNAYTMEENPRPDGTRNFRTGAGHIHIGWGADIPKDNPEHFAICAGFIKMMDATVGMLMTVIDQDPRRRDLYGKAGAFRAKSYGVEYRTPSNVWIRHRDYRQSIHLLTNLAISYMVGGHSVERLTGLTEDAIATIINEGDVKTAKYIVDKLARTGLSGTNRTVLIRTMEHAESKLAEPTIPGITKEAVNG